jgi:streptogramin lyase
VVKFAATPERCVDRNDNGAIDTSTGPTDVRPWGEDECMIWSTPMPLVDGDPMSATGARATAWDGTEDPDTGEGGHVWVGMCSGTATATAYKLDGDTGEIVATVALPTSCAYGGAMDGTNGFWVYDTNGRIVRVNTNSLSVFSREVSCGYGITVDSQGRVWTGGTGGIGNCVSRYDINLDAEDTMDVPGAEFLRGIAVGVELSAGYAWAADTSGRLYKLDEETMAVTGTYNVGAYNMIGVAVDFEGYVWTVSNEGNSTYKFDPVTETYITVPIGLGPYTYSDMTGAQLRNAIDPPE